MDLKRKKNVKELVEFADQISTNYSRSTFQRLLNQSDVHLARVDKPLLVFKAFYFFLYSSLATTFPFLSSYFRQIGFSSYQVDVLVSVRPFVQLLLSPLWGVLADRYLPKKMMLQFCTFVWLIGTISLAFVEPTGQMCQLVSLNETDSKVINSTVMQTGFFRRRRVGEYFTRRSKLIPRNPINDLRSTNGFDSVEVQISSGSGSPQESEVSGSGTGESFDHNREPNITSNNKTRSITTIPISNLKSKPKEPLNQIQFNFTTRNELRENTSRLHHIFVGALALVVFEEIFLCPVFFMADTVLLAKQVEEDTAVYGYQKQFGSIGYLIFFLITGILVNNSQRQMCGHIYADYVINFCFYCVITIVILLVLIKFEIPQRPVENFPNERFKTTYNTKHYGTFAATAAFMGFSHSVISKFHVTYLSKAKGGHITSTIMFFGFLGEPLGFFLSHKLIRHMGDINMIFTVLVSYMFNHFACSFVTSSWQLIPLGLLEGFTFATSFVVCTTYLANSSPLDCLATVQGVFQSIYWGVGGILGLVFGESLTRVAGPIIAFRVFTMAAVISIVIFTTGLKHLNFRHRNYYSVLLDTFHNCVDSEKIQNKNLSYTNDTRAQNQFNGQFQQASVGVAEPEASDSRTEDWDKYY